MERTSTPSATRRARRPSPSRSTAPRTTAPTRTSTASSTAAEEGDRDVAIENATGGGGNDRLGAGPGANVLKGGDGVDVLDGGLGPDTLDGGPGTDTLSYAARTTPVAIRLDGKANDGADPNRNSSSTATEEGDRDIAIENAVGGSGPDWLIAAGSAANQLQGAGGDDTLDGGLGTDVIDGGQGVDTITYAARTTPVAIRLDGTANDGADPNLDGTSTAAEEGDRDIAIENAEGGKGNDQLSATGTTANVLKGGNGDDVLDGGLGADTHHGGAGVDTVSYASRSTPVAVRLDDKANDGADPNQNGASPSTEEGDRDIAVENAIGGSGNDQLRAARSLPNSLQGRGGDDLLDGGLGADVLDGGGGFDTVTYDQRTTPVAVTLDGQANDGADPNRNGLSTAAEEGDRDIAVENATGGKGSDILRAIKASLVNVLTGGAGDDRLYTRDGSADVDKLVCGTGADSYQSDASDTRSACETAIP